MCLLYNTYKDKKQYTTIFPTGTCTKRYITYRNELTPTMTKANYKRKSVKKKPKVKKTPWRSQRIKENNLRKDFENELLKLDQKKREFLKEIITNPKDHIRWREYVKLADIWIPKQEDFDDLESELLYNLKNWHEPYQNPRFEYHTAEQEQRTTECIVEDIINLVIQPA